MLTELALNSEEAKFYSTLGYVGHESRAQNLLLVDI